ncbi:S1 family peptidase [Actinacidiphila oryziradicis]|uniref:S1 family peptidase n=1 Tax=Actinacidiphila oryziradicis TaxID=2571141 RepID=UPI0023F1133F|nr:S1 family peptidase [Actinacidiphila oryziradicis]
MNKRTGVIAVAGAAAIAGAAILLPSAFASSENNPTTKAFAPEPAAELGSALATALGDSAAGWYYNADAKQLVVNVLDANAAKTVTAKGAVAKVVQNSTAELTSATQTLKTTASVPGTAWSVDPKTNQVSVLADSTVTGTKWATLTKATNSLGGLVTVKRTAGEFKPFDGGNGKNKNNGNSNGAAATGAGAAADPSATADPAATATAAPSATADPSAAAAAGAAGAGGNAAAVSGVQGGDAIFGGNVRCSLGFNVDVNGAPAFLTAGHCGNDAATWSADQAGATQLGTVSVTTFPVSDFALVTYDDAATVPPSSVDLGNGQTQAITQAVDASVGLAVQRSGSTTGLHGGTVTGLNATVNYGNGDIVNGLIQTDVCAEAGDSGGPLFASDAAVGLTSGGSGDCTVGGETFFQPVTTALATAGATIGAGGAGASATATDTASAAANAGAAGDAGASASATATDTASAAANAGAAAGAAATATDSVSPSDVPTQSGSNSTNSFTN